MSFFLISKLKNNLTIENLKFVFQTNDNDILINTIKYIFKQNNKEAVLFLLDNNKIPASMTHDLFKFIFRNNYFDMFLAINYDIFDIHYHDDYALFKSIKENQIEIVKFLIEKGADINSRDISAFNWACINGYFEIAKLLIEKGVDIHRREDEVFRFSCECGQVNIAKLLIDNGANIHSQNDYALFYSCENDHIETVKFLIKNGANVHSLNDRELKALYENGSVKMIKILIKNGANCDIIDKYLLKTFIHKNIEIVKLLIEKYPNFSKHFPFLCLNGYYELVEFFIKKGGDFHIQDDNGLIYASCNGHLKIVKILIENGVDIHVQNDSALICACKNNQFEIVKFLIENGANIHAQNNEALIYSSQNNLLEIVEFLIRNGADIHARDDEAVIRAIKYINKEVVKFLIKNGANIHAQNDRAIESMYGNSPRHIELIEFLINLDIYYYLNNEYTKKLLEYYKLTKKYTTILKNEITNYIKTSNLEALEKYDSKIFLNDQYEFFSNALMNKNKDVVNLIFGKIEDKEKLIIFYKKIEYLFDEETKSIFYELFDNNVKLNHIKNKIMILLKEIELV